jgi:hypothetical protein
MNELFYELYKANRELIEFSEKNPLACNTLRDYIRESKINCERYDRKNTDMLNRWLKEKQTNE